MLKHLSIRNFAIIDQLDLSFFDGLTVLTGETGAGKSILIDAIALLLGDRASQDMIRSGEDYASVEAVFDSFSEEVRAKLTKLGISTLDENITIIRTVNTQNKNTIKINSQIVTLQDLKDVTKNLADVHSQFDTQRLINPSNYIDLIDGFLRQKMDLLVLDYKTSLDLYHQKLNEYHLLLKKKNELELKLEMYQFQLEELTQLNLENTDLEALKNEESTLTNFDQINTLLQESNAIFEEYDLLARMYQLKQSFEKLSKYNSNFIESTEKLNEFYYEIQDINHLLSNQIDLMSFDPETLQEIQDKIHQFEKIEKKYQMSIPSLIEYMHFIENEIDQSINYDSYLENAKENTITEFNKTIDKAKNITLLRNQIATKITKEIKVVLSDLVLPKTEFEIIVSEDLPTTFEDSHKFLNNGFNTVEFMISTNVGEPMKPLSKTASGGEMSRIMLAFKTIFIRSQNLSTIIFDEIDTGISGFVAKQIAKKIKEVSAYCQVLSITHIPQVVAIGDHHLKVKKQQVKNRTVAFTEYLDFPGRINEIAAMISGDLVTPTSIETAKELLLNK